jgi:hypothetical protein
MRDHRKLETMADLIYTLKGLQVPEAKILVNSSSCSNEPSTSRPGKFENDVLHLRVDIAMPALFGLTSASFSPTGGDTPRKKPVILCRTCRHYAVRKKDHNPKNNRYYPCCYCRRMNKNMETLQWEAKDATTQN